VLGSGGGGNKWLNLRNVLLFLSAFFVMRNLLRRDYREEEISYLRESGMSPEQIHRFIPRTAEEQKRYAESKTNDFEKMKKDIAYLLNEVAELKMQQNQSGGEQRNGHSQQPPAEDHASDNEREGVLKAMDEKHLQKRREQEDELLKNNPDFHASKRIKDMTEEEIQRALQKRR
jgi:hypothetical protein